MAEYRAYIMDRDGHVSRAIELVCPDDETAKKQARQLVDGHNVELWLRSRPLTASLSKTASAVQIH